MILRQFYVTENTNGPSSHPLIPTCILIRPTNVNTLTPTAPVPRQKAARVLKTDIPPKPSN